MVLFDQTPGARWTRIIEQLETRQKACSDLDRSEQMTDDIVDTAHRMDLALARMAAEMQILHDLSMLHSTGILDVVSEVLPTLAQRG